MPKSHFRRALAATLLAAFGAAVHAANADTSAFFGSLAVFGDSLSDSGNNAVALGTGGAAPTSNLYIPSGAPYAAGTYSNGPVWVTSFAAGLGLPALAAAPSLLGGGDNAFGGARTNDGSLAPPSAVNQLAGFLAGVTTLPADGLYVIAIGGNDARDTTQAVATGSPASIIAADAAAYATAVGNMVDALQAKGAQHIVVWDVPDIGKTPFALSVPGLSALGSGVAQAYNQALALRLAGEAGVIPFDIYGVVDAIVANPGAYGLVNVTDACGAVINACSAATALFYDGIHPTAAGHAVLASAMLSTVLAAVPEPSSVWMLAAGMGVLLLRRRRA
jgi:outer membrane lipase/esterase